MNKDDLFATLDELVLELVEDAKKELDKEGDVIKDAWI